MKLLASWHKFYVHHITMHQFTLSFHAKPHAQGASEFSCHLPPVLLAERSFNCCSGSTRVEEKLKLSQHRKLTLKKKIILPLLPGLEPMAFQHKCGALPLSCPHYKTKQLGSLFYFLPIPNYLTGVIILLFTPSELSYLLFYTQGEKETVLTLSHLSAFL